MTKTKNIFFSTEAKGKMGPIVAEQRRKGQYVRSKQPTKRPPSKKQKEKRKLYGQAVEAWRQLHPEMKKYFNTKAKPERISGFNFFLRYFTTAPQIAIYGIGIYGVNCYGIRG